MQQKKTRHGEMKRRDEPQEERGYLAKKRVVNEWNPEEWTGINSEKRRPIDKNSPNLTPQ